MTASTITAQILSLPEAPALAGLSFRRFRGPADFPHMVAVREGSKIADQIERVDTVEGLTATYAHLTNCDPYQDMIFAEIDGQVVGYSRVTWWQEINGPRVYLHFGVLLPEWRRKGIGRAMLRANERRLREIAASHPTDGERVLQSWADQHEHNNEALLQSEGYTRTRDSYDMLRPDLENLPDFQLPEGLEVRPVTPDQYRTIWEADQEAFQDHWGFTPGTEADYQSWLRFPHFEPSLWRVAWDGDQVAGQVRSFIDKQENVEYKRLRGYTEFISVRRPWRKRGLARALIAQSLHALRERGMREAELGVDAENLSGALRVYESCGFQVIRRNSVYRKPLDEAA